METAFHTTGLASTGGAPMRLRDILGLLQKIYSGKVGAEFAHISNEHERQWLRERFERSMLGDRLSAAERRDWHYVPRERKGLAFAWWPEIL